MAPRVEKTILRNRKDLAPFLNALAKILSHPFHGPEIEPIRGRQDLYRVKVNGRLRLIYEVRRDEHTIYLMALGHRDEVYSLN